MSGRGTRPGDHASPGRRAFLTAAGGLSLAAVAVRGAAQTPPPGAAAGDPTETIDLWPGTPPGMPPTPPVETVTERSTDATYRDRAVEGVARPRLVVFRPARPNGAAMLVTPGGGYRRIVIDKEGYELARWLVERGVTVFVLFYRLPGEGWAARADVPLADAQRAMRIIRHRSERYGIDPARIGALGFSAGGHVCADLMTRFAAAVYAPVDAADAMSARPCLAAPLYPVVTMTGARAHAGSRLALLGEAPTPAQEAAHSPHLNVPADAPPAFLLHAEDDEVVNVENTLLLRAALRARGIPVETHLFARGGHGFGLRLAAGKPVSAWPELFLAWSRGLLT